MSSWPKASFILARISSRVERKSSTLKCVRSSSDSSNGSCWLSCKSPWVSSLSSSVSEPKSYPPIFLACNPVADSVESRLCLSNFQALRCGGTAYGGTESDYPHPVAAVAGQSSLSPGMQFLLALRRLPGMGVTCAVLGYRLVLVLCSITRWIALSTCILMSYATISSSSYAFVKRDAIRILGLV